MNSSKNAPVLLPSISRSNEPLKEGICSKCESSFECGKLAMAITLLNEAAKGNDNDLVDDCLRVIEERLSRHRWSYPEASEPCSLACDRSRVRKITDEAISVVDVIRAKA